MTRMPDQEGLPLYLQRWLWNLILVLGIAALLAAGLAGRTSLGTVGSGGGTLVLTHRGTVMETSFRHLPAAEYWAYGGSAPPATRYATWSPGRLAVGVDNRGHKNYYGYFAVTRNTAPANSFVQAVVAPMTVKPGRQQTAETVVAVQTAWTKLTGLINYLVVSELSTRGRPKRLLAGYAHGHLAHATTAIYYSRHAAKILNGASPYVVTIRTDGYKTAQIWIDNRSIVARSDLQLNIEPPFQVYLEVQNVNIRYTAVFYRMSVYTGNTVAITGLPKGAQLTFAVAGRVWHETADAHGDARLTFSVPDLANVGTLTVTSGGKRWIFPALRLAGGDHFSFGQLPPVLQWLRYVPPAPWLTPAIPS